MIKSDNNLFYKVLCGVFAVLIIWIFAAVTDHSLVFEKEKTPVFCVSRRINNEVEIYYGMGYSYTFTEKDGKIERIDFENFLGANEYFVNCG